MTRKRERLDKLLVELGLVSSRSQGQLLIMAGEVKVNGDTAVKPATMVAIDANVEIVEKMPFVGRGGLKLAAAIEAFSIEVMGKTCADVGACTGGFTDVLLQNGASKVYSIDVGYGQLDWRLRQDERVIVMERTNARYLEKLPDEIEILTVDVSFISLRLILEAASGWLAAQADVIALIKPQFEAGREQVGKGGVIRDSTVRAQVLYEILNWAQTHGFSIKGLIRSPIQGAKGNLEYLAWMNLGSNSVEDLSVLVDPIV